jgi:hypothetical protein
MQRLVYHFERIQPSEGPKLGQPIVGDVIVAIAMAAVGIAGLQRRVEGSADVPQAVVSFANDQSLLKFNLRIERALAARGVKITKIQVLEQAPRRAAAQRDAA